MIKNKINPKPKCLLWFFLKVKPTFLKNYYYFKPYSVSFCGEFWQCGDKRMWCVTNVQSFFFFWEKMAPHHYIVKKKKPEFAIYRLQVPVGRQT